MQCFLDWPRQYGSVAHLDDRPLDQIRVGDHCPYHVGVRRVVGNSGRCCAASQFDRPEAGFFHKLTEILLSKRFIKIIDLVPLNAILTEQRCQIAAGGSGRFFVNGDLMHIKRWRVQAFAP